MIEIHTEFLGLILNDKDGPHKNVNGFMPMFGDTVRLLEAIDKKDVDYIVLCCGATVHDENLKVIALRTGDIKKQLINQNIPVYEYVGKKHKFCDSYF